MTIFYTYAIFFSVSFVAMQTWSEIYDRRKLNKK